MAVFTQLNLGCGRDIRPGCINVDIFPLPGVDVVADLDNCASSALPFKDNTVDLIIANHLIEHLRNPLPFMQELHRIAKPDARATFRNPYGSSDDAYEDPTHVRPYFLNSFQYFGQPFYWRADYGYRGDWIPEKVLLLLAPEMAGKTPAEIMQEVNMRRNIVREMITELRAIKPIREPRKELMAPPKIELHIVGP